MHELKRLRPTHQAAKFAHAEKKILRMVPIMITLLSHLSALKKFEYLLQPSATSEIWFYLFSRDQPHINLWDKFIVSCYVQIFGRSTFERSIWSKYVRDWILNLYHDFFRQNNCCALNLGNVQQPSLRQTVTKIWIVRHQSFSYIFL